MSVRSEILQFLRDPRTFSQSVSPDDKRLWLNGLSDFAEVQTAEKGDYPLRDSQRSAWNGLADSRVGLIQGPPGTGKTYVLSWMALGYLQARQREGLPCRILVTAFTLNALGNLLDAMQSKATRYLPSPPSIVYLGNRPAGGLNPAITYMPLRDRAALEQAWETLQSDCLIVGCTVWALNRLLRSQPSDGPTARLFHLVCIDESSQMVVSNGLMALAGLAEGGRVLVAGDDKQLPPVRSIHAQEINGRRLGGSLYDFLKSANVMEFPLEETFRLNEPLTRFPEERFYPGHYRSTEASADSRLKLRNNWEDGLESWERIALDPAYPLCVLLHDGPPAGTSNLFEINVVTRLVRHLHHAMASDDSSAPQPTEAIWQERLAVISPHRAQNAAIRAALAGHAAGTGAVIETVDKIQGKERDAIIASYTVSDPEFALAEADFIFSVERLNVTITRARTKLILIVSRRLLDVVPSDESTLDAAQILRELVFDSEEVGTVQLSDNTGRKVPVNIRVRGFTPGGELPPIIEKPDDAQAEQLPMFTDGLKEILTAIKDLAIKSSFGSAPDYEIKKKLFLPAAVPFDQLRDLVRLGRITLDHKAGKFGPFWVAKPLLPTRPPFAGDSKTIRERLEQVLMETRKGRFAPFYSSIRQRFVWMDLGGDDVVWPVIDSMAREHLVNVTEVNNSPTIEWVQALAAPEPTDDHPKDPLSDKDFEVLNHLEDLEAQRINFGITEGWTSSPELAASLNESRGGVSDALRRLQSHGHLLIDEDGRIRSRMAELAREVRYVKQRFSVDDADRRPYLVRSLKLEVRDREKPVRDQPLSLVMSDLRDHVKDDHAAVNVLDGLESMLRVHWNNNDPSLAGFQARALKRIFSAWLGREASNAFVVTADTGSGKTEAACFPLIAGAAYDVFRGIKGTRAILVYPRVRLAANQAQRITGYLAALVRSKGMPQLTVGLQNFQVPKTFKRIYEDMQEIWQRTGSDTFTFPFFDCPDCGKALYLHCGKGYNNVDRLKCTECDWVFDGWVGSKIGLRTNPPTFFLPVTESLHQWQQDPKNGALFGDVSPFSPPRAVLADEIHLYTHVQGAQVGYTLRRLLARCSINKSSDPAPLAIGMSATLGHPAHVWGELIGHDAIEELRPDTTERQRNPRGREYFYFIQPEVESRGKDIAGASTTIQSLMCLAHGMRRRTGADGGYRTLVFLDSIDKVKRVHSDFQDAEEAKGLAALRTRLYDDDPGTTFPRRECCGQPATCDRFRAGECWYFAATDPDQRTVRGPYRPGTALAVADRVVFSGTEGKVEGLIRRSDVVFTTSSLEVGYDDPDIALVYQHYAPKSLASFIQRKGRGGRGVDDRPVTAITLSPYSPRDSWFFRRPHQMLDSATFEVPLNVGNYFVRRGQVLAALLDTLARRTTQGQAGLTLTGGELIISDQLLEDADTFIHSVFGGDIYRQLGFSDLAELWRNATVLASSTLHADMQGSELRKALPWIPKTLFSIINLPVLAVCFAKASGETTAKDEAITLAFMAATPGNVTRRYGFTLLHWIPPKDGRNPWLTDDVYEASEELACPALKLDAATFLRDLPIEVRDEIGADIHPTICLPRTVSLEVAGKMFGSGWTSNWYFDADSKSVQRISTTEPPENLKVHHKSRGTLRGFTHVTADPDAGHAVSVKDIEHIGDRFEAFYGGQRGGDSTGLSITSLTWGADTELRLMDAATPDIPFTQTFIHPHSGKTLFHGYRVETEGVRLHMNVGRLAKFTSAELARLKEHPDGRWHRAQMFRFLIGSRGRAAGLNTYDASRIAELLFSAAAHPDHRATLKSIVKRWDSQTLKDLLQLTYRDLLSQHPLLSERRVDRLAGELGDRRFQGLFADAFEAVRSTQQFADYLHSVIIHSIGVRLKQAFVLHGRGDEQQVILHAKLPIQFGETADSIITIAEDGAHGDGTTRMFVDNLDTMREGWCNGVLTECPNARVDDLIAEVFRHPERHSEWRNMDPRDSRRMTALAEELGLNETVEGGAMQGVMRVLYGFETVGRERVELYGLSAEIRDVEARLRERMDRDPSTWELVSFAVRSADASPKETPLLARLLEAYKSLDDAAHEGSLSAEARLADQVYRLSARLCIDGCQGCLHTGSDLMPEALAESAVSRRLLERFVNDF